MRVRVVLIISLLMIPWVLGAQNDYWFKRGLDEKKPEKQVEYFTKSIETEGAKAETYLHRGDAYSNLALDASYNHRGIVIVFGHSETLNGQLMFEKAKPALIKPEP